MKLGNANAVLAISNLIDFDAKPSAPLFGSMETSSNVEPDFDLENQNSKVTELSFHDIKFSISTKGNGDTPSKDILKGISGSVKPGI